MDGDLGFLRKSYEQFSVPGMLLLQNSKWHAGVYDYSPLHAGLAAGCMGDGRGRLHRGAGPARQGQRWPYPRGAARRRARVRQCQALLVGKPDGVGRAVS